MYLYRCVYFYRYVSLAVTSLFYLTGSSNIPINKKLTAIICLSTASIILNYLYVKNQTEISIVKLLIIIEIAGNMIILIPTGGISSPYIWYSLNTVLVTMYYFDKFYCSLNVTTYLVFVTFISAYVFDDSGLVQAMLKDSNLLLGYILISAAIEFLFTAAKKLDIQSQKLRGSNEQLISMNQMLNESIEHIMAIYKTVNSLKDIGSRDKLAALLAEYAAEMTKTSLAFFCADDKVNGWEIKINNEEFKKDESSIIDAVKNEYDKIQKTDSPVYFKKNGREFIAVSIQSIKSTYGLLGVELDFGSSAASIERVNQLKFLSALAQITFERFELEGINEHLLITNEQKRIADEIHDSTSQRLFAASCMINSIIKNVDEEKSRDQLMLVRDSLGKAIRELRETIYGLSSKNSETNAFEVDIENYLNDIARLYNVKMTFDISGNQDIMGVDIKRAVFMIICESTGNSIRHGKSSNINIKLDIKKKDTNLIISDDGTGFDLKEKFENKNMGLGIKNIYNHVYMFDGNINIESNTGKGTCINISLPNRNYLMKEEAYS